MTSKLDPKILEYALQSLEAGQALEDIAPTRSVLAPIYKYGMHLGNWTDGGSAGLEREQDATLPTSILYMENVKGQPLNLQLERLKTKEVKPIIEYRHYFNPNNGTSGAAIEDYANTVITRFRDEYLPQPLIQEAYNEGRVIFKLFNETNIGGEGFARGRVGFADALRCWKQTRAIVKNAYPLGKFMSIANTPGNDDLWFTGDTQNAPYWYHGSEAAKATPTPSEIQAAINSCPFREMFQLCDVIGIHVYAQDERQTRGDLQTWYSRRHEQALKFLTPYIAQGKKMIISECDCGYDQQPNPQQARADLFVWWLANVVGTNDAILTVNHWWNSDDGEGAQTWEKHQTRKGGEFRPVVNAIANFRNGATPPNPNPVPPNPTPTPPNGTINLPAWVTVQRATVQAGQQYWKLKSAYWKDSDTSGGLHHIFVEQPHDPTKSFNVSNGQSNWNVPLDKPTNEPAGNFAMFAGNVYTVKMNGLPSDTVSGMTMPQNQHVAYYLTYELTTMTNPNPTPIPPTDPIRWDKVVWAFEQSARILKNEGYISSHDWILNCFSYREAKAKRDGSTPPPPPTLVINRTRQSPNFDDRPLGTLVDTCILHHTGGGLKSSLNWLTNPTSGVSTHYLIAKDGTIYQLVDEDKRAWHAGNSEFKGKPDCNDYSIGIELENAGDGSDPYTQPLLDSLVLLLGDLKRRGVKRDRVTTHKAVALPKGRKNDPSPNFPLEEVLNRVYG